MGPYGAAYLTPDPSGTNVELHLFTPGEPLGYAFIDGRRAILHLHRLLYRATTAKADARTGDVPVFLEILEGTEITARVSGVAPNRDAGRGSVRLFEPIGHRYTDGEIYADRTHDKPARFFMVEGYGHLSDLREAIAVYLGVDEGAIAEELGITDAELGG
jgi:hypothetical protein